MGEIIRYSFPTAIAIGPGARALLIDALKAAGSQRPLLVTDEGLAKLPLIGEFRDLLATGGLEPAVFSGLWGNPVKSQVTAGVESYREHQADAIVGVGGGAAMDVAKVIALMVNHPGDLFDYEDGKPDGRPVDQPIPFMAMLPTTAGTGSEVGRSSVISDDETKAKKIIFDPKMLPNLALLDPELSQNLPPNITATTGLDALCHLVEAYLAKGTHPMADGIALEGIRLIREALIESVGFAAKACGREAAYPQAVAALTDDSHERHMYIRQQMLNAAMMGAVAFQKGLGATHSVAHALSSVCDTHHGLANGILMPYVMRFNLEAVPERFVAMAKAAGLERATGEAFVQWLVELQAILEVPQSLSAAGVPADATDALADYAFQDICHQMNPRACDRDALRGIIVAAMG